MNTPPDDLRPIDWRAWARRVSVVDAGRATYEGWRQVSYRGGLVWATSHMVDLRGTEPRVPGWRNRVATAPRLRSGSADELVTYGAQRAVPLRIVGVRDGSSDAIVVFEPVTNPTWRVALASRFVRYFGASVDWWGTGDGHNVLARDGAEWVGLVAPCRM